MVVDVDVDNLENTNSGVDGISTVQLFGSSWLAQGQVLCQTLWANENGMYFYGLEVVDHMGGRQTSDGGAQVVPGLIKSAMLLRGLRF